MNTRWHFVSVPVRAHNNLPLVSRWWPTCLHEYLIFNYNNCLHLFSVLHTCRSPNLSTLSSFHCTSANTTATRLGILNKKRSLYCMTAAFFWVDGLCDAQGSGSYNRKWVFIQEAESQIRRSNGTSLHLLSVLAHSSVPSPPGWIWQWPVAVCVWVCVCAYEGCGSVAPWDYMPYQLD